MKKLILILALLSNTANAVDTFASPSSPTQSIIVIQSPTHCEIVGNAFICD